MLRDLTPAAVLGLGGFAAAPVVQAAARLGARTGLLNPDAVPGRANRHLAARVDVMFTQFDSTEACFRPALRAKVRAVGCPVRASITSATRGEGLAEFDLRADRRTLLVCGGSQGAASINAAFAALLAGGDLEPLADTWQALHVTGTGKGVARDAGRDRFRVRSLEYCERMDLAYAAADVVLGRGGAVTIAELAAAATPAVIMPYPHHADRQQRLNAEPLVAAGAAVLCEDRQDARANAQALCEALVPLMRQPERLESMHSAAGRRARPAAARDVAAWLTGA